MAATLFLFGLYPLAWQAPLLRAGLLPFFGLSEISVVSGLVTLWQDTPALAALVALFAVVAPWVKLAGLYLAITGRLPRSLAPVLQWIGRLAMADVFLIALYVVIAKGVGLGRVEVAWGFWLFTACTLASLALAWVAKRH
ncbi:paraquat-inducible protein A [Frigidibacter sp. MR17.14]|uniref:paraquat-inducible protein A n=1 Tax=Frigidibacter sp. MR17.14 TaxID=3126509 RepID=UPI003012CFFD